MSAKTYNCELQIQSLFGDVLIVSKGNLHNE
jgi:hypothetical protein